MKFVAALLVLSVVAVSAFSEVEYTGAFTQWMADYGVMYTAEEFQVRYGAFKANMDYVAEWNAGGSETVLGLNKFADLTNRQYRETYLGYRPKFRAASPVSASKVATFKSVALPTTVDWRVNGSVTPVKDQGQCGSCWAFSATGSVEAAHFFSTKNLVSLSEQNLMDCSKKEGDQACNGGEMDDAFEYIIKNKGVDTEASYPYTATTQKKCLYSIQNVGATISSYKDIAKDSEADLQTAVATVGPISVAIDANHNSFQLYKSGVYYEPACSATSLDHGVLAVGYGTSGTSDYWLVKNSWGTTWGIDGYIQMSRNRKNNCGIATSASYPIV